MNDASEEKKIIKILLGLGYLTVSVTHTQKKIEWLCNIKEILRKCLYIITKLIGNEKSYK